MMPSFPAALVLAAIIYHPQIILGLNAGSLIYTPCPCSQAPIPTLPSVPSFSRFHNTRISGERRTRCTSESALQAKAFNGRDERPKGRKKKIKSRSRNRSQWGGPWEVFLRSAWKAMTVPFPALRRMAQHHPKSVGLSFREGMVLMALYLSLGVFSYHVLLEKWCIVDALYFTCVCFSTVGYGDLCPTTAASKLFTCAFGVGGIVFLGAAISTVGSSLVQAEMEAVNKARDAKYSRVMGLFHDMPHKLPKFRKKRKSEQKQALQEANASRDVEIESVVKKGLIPVMPRFIPSIFAILFGGWFVGFLDGGMSPINTIYYSLMTASTIGFGDISPSSRAARIAGIVYIPLAVASAGEILSGIALALTYRRQQQVYREQLEHDLTIEHLHIMDTNGDGKITREEYVQFMLMEMGRVSKSELDKLFEQFDKLDVTRSGYLDNEDLKLMAKLRGARVKEAEGSMGKAV